MSELSLGDLAVFLSPDHPANICIVLRRAHDGSLMSLVIHESEDNVVREVMYLKARQLVKIDPTFLAKKSIYLQAIRYSNELRAI